MQRSTMGRGNPEIERVINELLTADANFDRNENRSVHRDHLVRPVRLEFKTTGQLIDAFSRNVSDAGIGIITNQEIASGVIAVLEIERLNGAAVKLISECRWCKKYSENWFLSGWQFQNIKRGN